MTAVALLGALVVQQPTPVERSQPPAPPLAAPVIRAVRLMLDRGDTLAKAYPWAWKPGQRFIVMTDRSQVVLAAPVRPSAWFVPATDSEGRPVLPGRVWVAPSRPHPWDTTSFAPVESLMYSLPSSSFSEGPLSPDIMPVERGTAEGIVAGLIESALRDAEGGPTRGFVAQPARFSGVRSICPAGPSATASCTTVRTIERRLLLEAFATTRSRRAAIIRRFLAIHYLREANGDPVRYFGPSFLLEAIEERVQTLATGVVLGVDSAAYDSTLFQSPPDSEVATVGLMLRLLDRLGVDWSHAVADGKTAAQLLEAAVDFDPRRGVLEAERILADSALGGKVTPPHLGGADPRLSLYRAVESQEVRTRYYAAALQRLAGDSMAIGFEVPIAWLHDPAKFHMELSPGPPGGFAVGDSGSAIYPRVARLVLRTADFNVDVHDVPVAVMARWRLGPDAVMVAVFLPDDFLLPVRRRLPYASARDPITLDAPGLHIELGRWTDVDQTIGLWRITPTPEWKGRGTPSPPR